MATSLLALIDDIATLLDDVSLMAKVAAKKTAGVLGDDLALNAEQVRGVSADRELPVVWAVFKGSLVNKLILIPAALAISALAPWAVMPLLMAGGLYLCFEGVEKIAHNLSHSAQERNARDTELEADLDAAGPDIVAFERDKVKGAIRTDFVLSAEIIVITLGTVESADLLTQLLVLSAIGALMTIGVYGFVAGIVKLDDAGLYLTRISQSGVVNALGRGLLALAPLLMKTLSIAGTVAMFLVGGGIITHGTPALHHGIEHLTALTASVPSLASLAHALMPLILDAIVGLVAGAIALLAYRLVGSLKKAAQPT